MSHMLCGSRLSVAMSCSLSYRHTGSGQRCSFNATVVRAVSIARQPQLCAPCVPCRSRFPNYQSILCPVATSCSTSPHPPTFQHHVRPSCPTGLNFWCRPGCQDSCSVSVFLELRLPCQEPPEQRLNPPHLRMWTYITKQKASSNAQSRSFGLATVSRRSVLPTIPGYRAAGLVPHAFAQ